MIKINDIRECTGCLICELACSFHHTRGFSRRHSSIKVLKSLLNPAENKISILADREATQYPCDECRGEACPFCVEHCPENVLRYERKGVSSK